MKIDVTRRLTRLDGEALETQDGKATTLRLVCTEALLAPPRDERPSEKDKVEWYLLAHRIHDEDELDLSVNELALLQRLVGKKFTPLVAGQAILMLEGREE